MFTKLEVFGLDWTTFSIEHGKITLGFDEFLELDNGFLRRVFATCGSSITSITFSKFMPIPNCVEKDVLYSPMYTHKSTSLLINHFQNVTELRYAHEDHFSLNWSVEGNIFHELCSQLTSLEWSSFTHMRLSDLSSYVNIKKLMLPILNADEMARIFPLIGNTLEDLDMGTGFNSPPCPSMLDIIQKHCKNLTRVICFVWLMEKLFRKIRCLSLLLWRPAHRSQTC